MKTVQVIQPCQVRVRHVKLGASTDPDARQVLGVWMVAQDPVGVNGQHGWTRGEYTPALGEEGEARLTFPNAIGEDGELHRRRFAITQDRGAYHPGDEFLEIRRVTGPGLQGELLGVFTPLSATMSRTSIELQLVDALWLMNKQRETASGVWTGHAPRDVFEHYTHAWLPVLFDDFTQTSRFTTSTSDQTTADGLWTYRRCTEQTGGVVRLVTPGDTSGNSAYIKSSAPRLTAQGNWRVEATIVVREAPATPQLDAYLSIYDTVGSVELARLAATQVLSGGVNYLSADAWTTSAATARRYVPCPGRPEVNDGLELRLAIERRDRWTFFYMQDELVTVLPSAAEASNASPQIRIISNSLSLDVDVVNVNARELRPFLNRSGDRGDARLPGNLSAGGIGGLIANYYDDADLAILNTGGAPLPLHLMQLNPTREPVVRRQEQQINFQTADPDPPAWQPPGIPASNWSVRFVGAVYLDLDNHDYAFRTSCDDRARVWIGDTRWGEQIIDDWTSGGHPMATTTSTWLKAGSSAGSAPSGATGPLAGEQSGWFPIVIEYSQTAGPGGLVVELQRETGVGTWEVLGSRALGENLSPLGIHQGTARLDSHYEQLLALRDTFGLQFTLQPMSLESDEFPGRLIPRVREGRDTDYVLDTDEGTDIQTTIDARETCDTLLLDAQGIGDPAGGGQLTKEAIDYTAAQPGEHLLLTSEYDSLSEITIPELARQRANALLLLKGLPWEEVGVKPAGNRDLTDTFPLTGEAALFAWAPGDGVRLSLPELDIRDLSCRQIISPSWPITPDGIGCPDVRFRQRPRGFGRLIRKMIRDQRTPQRVYQGQLTLLPGSIGSVNDAGGSDQFSRITLPADLTRVVSVTLIVLAKGGATAGTIRVNGAATPMIVTATGRYDLTPWLRRTGQHMFVDLTGLGAEVCVYQLLLETTI